jgi:ribosomal protein S19
LYLKISNNIIANNSYILNNLYKKKVKIYDGKNLKFFTITEGMLGLKAGEFVFSRKFGQLHKKKVLKGKQIKKK